MVMPFATIKFGGCLHLGCRVAESTLPLHQTMHSLGIGLQAMLRISFADRTQHLIEFGIFAKVRGDFAFDRVRRLALSRRTASRASCGSRATEIWHSNPRMPVDLAGASCFFAGCVCPDAASRIFS